MALLSGRAALVCLIAAAVLLSTHLLLVVLRCSPTQAAAPPAAAEPVELLPTQMTPIAAVQEEVPALRRQPPLSTIPQPIAKKEKQTVNINDAEFDIVYTWVNGSDPSRIELRKTFKTEMSRIRDNGELFYSLRSLDQFMPWWHGQLYIVATEIPCWLNTAHPRLHVIHHRDIFVNQDQTLPTFSSQAIELNFHRIPGLRPRFVLMNDDFFVAAPVTPQDFFRQGRAVLRFEPNPVFGGETAWDKFRGNKWIGSMLHSRSLLDSYYGIQEGSLFHPGLPPGLFHNVKHAPTAMFTQRLARMWEMWPQAFMGCLEARARSKDAVQPSFLHHQTCLLDSGPCIALDQETSNREALFLVVGGDVANSVRHYLNTLLAGEHKFFNINDSLETEKDMENFSFVYNQFLPRMYPTKSQWETIACPGPRVDKVIM